MHTEGQIVLPMLLGAFAIDRPILIGHSEGASIALIHAGTFNGTPIPECGDVSILEPLGVAVMAPHLFVERATVSEIARVNADFGTSGLSARLARHHRDPSSTFRNWADLWLSTEFQDWNIENQVATIRCPLLAIQGQDDQYGSALQIDRLANLCPHAKTLLLPDCRHSPHRDQPAAVLAALTGFIAGLPH